MIGTFFFSQLQSLTFNIVSIIILDHTTLFYASSSRPTLEQALDMAYSQYRASNTHNAVMKQFSAPPQTYSILKFIEFILKYRL
jgi:hypothetical protein